MERSMEGKSVVITGGATEIGRAVSLLLAREGALITVCGGGQFMLDRIAREAARENLPVETRFVDVMNDEQLQNCIDTAAERQGGIDALVNPAGRGGPPDLASLPEEEWRLSMRLNLRASWRGCVFALPHMRRKGGGAVVNFAAPGAHRWTTEFCGAYAVMKAGVEAMTRSLARELAAEHIRVNCVASPGIVYSAAPAFPGGNPAEVARGIAFLASARSSALTGYTLRISGEEAVGRAAFVG